MACGPPSRAAPFGRSTDAAKLGKWRRHFDPDRGRGVAPPFACLGKAVVLREEKRLGVDLTGQSPRAVLAALTTGDTCS